jgi:hypothetical protein
MIRPKSPILLSEGFYWPPHYDFTGKRDIETLAAICEWDGTKLTGDEYKILQWSMQSKIEKVCLKRFILSEPLLDIHAKEWQQDLRRRYQIVVDLRRKIGLPVDEDMEQYIVSQGE